MTEPEGPLGFEGQAVPPPGQRSKTPLIAGAALLVAVLLGVGIGVLVSGDDDPDPRQESLSEETPTPTPTPGDVGGGTPTPSVTASTSATPSTTASATASTTASTSASSSATTSVSASASASPGGSPTPSSSTTVPVGAVTATFELDRTSVAVDGTVNGTLTVRNGRNTAITLIGDCTPTTTIAPARAQLVSGPDAPTTLTGTLKLFRDRALNEVPDPVRFGSETCTSPTPKPFAVRAGETATQRYSWKARSTNGSPYDGLVTVTVAVTYTTADRPSSPVAVATPTRTVRMTGGSATRLTAAQAVEKALADPDFAAAVNASDTGAWPPAGGTRYVEFDGTRFVVYLTQTSSGGVSVTVSGDLGGAVGDPKPFTRSEQDL